MENTSKGGVFAVVLIYVLLFQSFLFSQSVQIPIVHGTKTSSQTLNLDLADKTTDQMVCILTETTPLSLMTARIMRNPYLTGCWILSSLMFLRTNPHFYASVSTLRLRASHIIVPAQKNSPLQI